MTPGLLDLPSDVLVQRILASLRFTDKLALALTCSRGQKLLLSPSAWPEVEAVLTPDSYPWLCKYAPYAASLTIKAPLAIAPHCVPRYCEQIQAVLHRANQGVCRELRLWGPRVHPGCFPRSLQTVRLDCWAYEGADVRALVHLPSLRTLTLHFLPEEHVPHLADLQQLWELDLVSLHCPSVAGEHDLHDTLQPLTRLKGLRSLMIQELACPLPWNLPRGCDLRLDLNICELKRQPSALPSYTNLVALALFGVSRGVDVDLAVLQPCARLASLTLKSCRNISCIPPLPCLASFTVVSYGDLCMHFPPEGLPALSDLRLYGTKLTSNLDYRGEASTSLASTLRTLVVATQQSNTAIVLAQAIRARGTVLQHVRIKLPKQVLQKGGSRMVVRSSMARCQEALDSPSTGGLEEWTALTTDPALSEWVLAQHKCLSKVYASYAGSVLP